jgi:hypothetical protein
MWRVIGTCLERPSKRARASERFDLRTRVEIDEVVTFVATERRWMGVDGAGVREMARDGRGTSRAGMGVREGRRGAADLGTSGRVVEGAGLGDGIDLKESESDNLLENDELRNRTETQNTYGEVTGFRFKLAERMDWDSAKSRERKDLYSG